MKKLTDFVTNSSSTCYVVVAKGVKNRQDIDDGRCTAVATGDKLLEYVNCMIDRNGFNGYYAVDDTSEFRNVLHIIDEHGKDNVAFLRESDEDMGGQLTEEEWELINKHKVYEFEYH